MPQIPDNVRGARFIGWGTSLGHTTVTNDDLSKTMDTNDEWIRERTGIHRRHIGGSTAEMSIASGRAAIEMAGIDPLSIDALVLATTTPDRTVPATSATVQHALGLRWRPRQKPRPLCRSGLRTALSNRSAVPPHSWALCRDGNRPS